MQDRKNANSMADIIGALTGRGLIERHPDQADRRRLVVSLTTADPIVRGELMPVEAAHPTGELIQAIRDYHAATGRRVTLAWIMIAGVNTREEDAQRLAELTRGLPITLDLIDVNDPTGRFQPPSPAELSAFRDALTAKLAMPVARRYSGGRDIHAAREHIGRVRIVAVRETER